MSDAIEKFEIDIPQAALDDLRRRLEQTRFNDQIEGTGWEYGLPVGYLQELVAYWRDKYDWRAQERALNQLDHFRTRIDGQSIHFVHARSRHEAAFPVVISHGWPGTIVEFLKVIPMLTDPEAHGGSAEDAFHVITPSLPGYGFSEPTRTRGWDTERIARAFIELMARLGYASYGAQGGDWGALITTHIGRLDPEHCAGIHTNMAFAQPPAGSDELSEAEQATLDEMARWQKEESGYSHIQGTKPQTLGAGLNDSPAGLAAWIIEKFNGWSDCDGHPENSFSRDELLTNVMVYWLTQTITSSTRLYYETMHSGGFSASGKVGVPCGVAQYPKEIMRFPRAWVEQSYNLTHWSEMPRGGHFAAMEVPELFVEDVRKFFRQVR